MKRLILFAIFLTLIPQNCLFANDEKKLPTLRDGLALAGTYGKLKGPDTDNKWFFELGENVSDYKTTVKQGSRIELMPSTMLEKIIEDSKTRHEKTYRIWGVTTNYNEQNFIFAYYFMPVKEFIKKQTNDHNQAKNDIAVNESDDAFTLPDEVIKKLITRKVVRIEQIKQGIEIKENTILANRDGFILDKGDQGLVFVPDSLGRNIGDISFKLLPCQTLERALHAQKKSFEPVRFKVAGVVTKYNEEYYLLLQRAVKVYNYGNFGR